MQPNEQQPNVPPQDPPRPPEPAQTPVQPVSQPQPPLQPIVVPEAQPVTTVPQPAQPPQEAVTTEANTTPQSLQMTDLVNETELPQLNRGGESQPPLPQAEPVQWQSPEYIAPPKPPIWFIVFWLFVIVLMAIAAFVVKSWSFTVLVPVMAAALMIYSHRPPRVLNYVLSAKGLYINDVLHPLTEFRTFGIIQDETIPALMLIPVKRFRPGLTVYFPQENGEAIVDLLGSRIPMEPLKLDVFDKIVRKLRI